MAFKVKATLQGYFNNKIHAEGKVFYINHVKEFSHNWMKSLDSKLDAALHGKKGVAAAPVQSGKKAVTVIQPEPKPEHEEEVEIDEEPLDESEAPIHEDDEHADRSDEVI